MKSDRYLEWELIEHDPMLRLELISIERHDLSGDEMVAELVEFYSRVEGITRLTAVVYEK
jgi:hypothetical protein